jgi:hypothetical protein
MPIVYDTQEWYYLSIMASILTIDQQRTAGSAARKVGGYAELIRLEQERRAAKGQGHIQKDQSGRVVFTGKSATPRAK